MSNDSPSQDLRTRFSEAVRDQTPLSAYARLLKAGIVSRAEVQKLEAIRYAVLTGKLSEYPS